MRSGVSMLLPESLLTFLVVAAVLAMVADSNCPDKCGNVSIPHPFGIGEECFREGFEISCTNDNFEVINVSIVPAAQAIIYQPISYACYDKLGNQKNGSSGGINLTDTAYRFSNTRNKFRAVGCDNLAFIEDPSDQTPISMGHQIYIVDIVNRSKLNSYVWSFNPCSYAFLAEQWWYEFNSSDLKMTNFIEKTKKGVPLVLDWAIGNETCEQAKKKLTGAYACLSENSNCLNSSNGYGYTCICSDGYQGNPYNKGGCQESGN